MNDDRIVMLTLSRLEARHLADLVAQFAALLSERDGAPDDALGRLTPDAYRDDAGAAAEFRAATAGDLLDRREAEALSVLASLSPAFQDGEDPDADAADNLIDIALDDATGWKWMRTLAAVRLVIAERLGIRSDADLPAPGEEPDGRFAVYDWLGYRLDGIVQALSPSD